MTITIAVAGKGGTGKTTIAALLIQTLARRGVVLAIDADPATNLHMALGLPLEDTVGAIREEMLEEVKSGQFPRDLAKQDYLDLKIQEARVESDHLDLLAMGRPEGPGCYCAANSMLRTCIDRLSKNYDFVVIDCEAGMEHISRQTTRDIDILLLVADPTLKGVATARLMKELIAKLRSRTGRVALVINRLNGSLSPAIGKAIKEGGLELVATLPEDPYIGRLEAEGSPLSGLPEDSPLKKGVQEIIQKLNLSP